MLEKILFSKREDWILPAFRVVYPLFIIFELLREKNSLFSRVGSMMCNRIDTIEFLGLAVLNEGNVSIVYYGTLVSLGLLSVGFFTHFVGVVSSFLFFYLIGSNISCSIGENPDYIPWNHAIVVFNLLILSLSRSNLRFSLDKVLLKFKSSDQVNWPLFLLKFNLIYAYFSSAFAKLQFGLDWMNGYSLQAQMMYRHLNLETPAALFLINSNTLSMVISIVVVLTELLSPLALFSRWFAVFFVLGSLVFQLAFALMIELRWMEYFGWAYLIYLLELLAVMLAFRSSSQRA